MAIPKFPAKFERCRPLALGQEAINSFVRPAGEGLVSSIQGSTNERDMTQASTIEADAFVGQWRGLVSTTNWEKGRIIFEWRLSQQQENAPAADYSDESWSQLVGGVTPQHVGRLRRVYDRFHDVSASYEGLFWSHFHAAIDWDDAEMWLEGAVQNKWSVSQMRKQRWETLGSIPELEPQEDSIVTTEVDEDIDLSTPKTDSVESSVATVENLDKKTGDVDQDDFKPFPDELTDDHNPQGEVSTNGQEASDNSQSHQAPVRPFENLAELPDDVAAAFEGYKLAIINHRMAGWKDISQNDLVASLESLKQLALAPE